MGKAGVLAAWLLVCAAPVLAQGREHTASNRSRVPVTQRDQDLIRLIAEDLRARYPNITLKAITSRLVQGTSLADALTELGVSPTNVEAAVEKISDEADQELPHRDKKGEYEVVTGFDSTFVTGTSSLGSARLPQSFWIAASPRISFGLDADAVVSDLTESGARATGGGDVDLNLCVVALPEAVRGWPNLLAFYDVKVPSARAGDELGSGEFDHTVGIEITKGFGFKRSLVLASELGETWLGLGGGVYASAPYALVKANVYFGRSQRFGLQTKWEWSAAVAGSPASVETVNTILWVLNDTNAATTYTLQAGPRVGLTDGSSRWAGVVRLIVDGAIPIKHKRPS